MPCEFFGPCGYIHITLVVAACVCQLPTLLRSTWGKKAVEMAEWGISVKAGKAVESSTETLQLPIESESGISDNKRALLEKLKRLEKHTKKVTLNHKAKHLEAEISRRSIRDDIGTGKEVEDGNGSRSLDDTGKSLGRSCDKRRRRSASRERQHHSSSEESSREKRHQCHRRCHRSRRHSSSSSPSCLLESIYIYIYIYIWIIVLYIGKIDNKWNYHMKSATNLSCCLSENLLLCFPVQIFEFHIEQCSK